jgi:hypothetical protein
MWLSVWEKEGVIMALLYCFIHINLRIQAKFSFRLIGVNRLNLYNFVQLREKCEIIY